MKRIILVFIFLLAGCIYSEPRCLDPYMLHMGECCLDENADGICDKDKPVCKKPYITYANTCCLDKDANKICDEHESVVETTQQMISTSTLPTTTFTSTTSTSTSSTIAADFECVRLEDCESFNNVTCDSLGREVYVAVTPVICSDGKCVYRSSKETSAYPCLSTHVCINGQGCVNIENVVVTSTTLIYRYDYSNILNRVAERNAQSTSTTTTTIPDCIDSDMGREYYKFSENVSGVFFYNGTVINTSEYCLDGKNLIEYYCESGYLKSRNYECRNVCVDGRCCVSNNNRCLSDKDCCSGRCKTIGFTSYCL